MLKNEDLGIAIVPAAGLGAGALLAAELRAIVIVFLIFAALYVVIMFMFFIISLFQKDRPSDDGSKKHNFNYQYTGLSLLQIESLKQQDRQKSRRYWRRFAFGVGLVGVAFIGMRGFVLGALHEEADVVTKEEPVRSITVPLPPIRPKSI